MSDRATLLNQWLAAQGFEDYSLRPASEDASFRSYLRLECGLQSLIVMDAPPEQEPCDQFIKVAQMLRAAGLSAPEIHAASLEQGFLLLTDFGSRDYLSALDPATEAALYGDALAALLQMQKSIDADDLPPYDEALLRREMELFREWFLERLLGVELDARQRAIWESTQQALVANALAQPQVFVHRDYHSRNLMVIERGNPGILDFQDAVRGPLTYDLLSLLRDCYIDWPPARVEQLAHGYYLQARANELLVAGEAQFMRWFDLMGIQRHLKAIGIFSRLKIRDGKSGYIGDIPRTFGYLRRIAATEMPMLGLCSIIEQLELERRVAALSQP